MTLLARCAALILATLFTIANILLATFILGVTAGIAIALAATGGAKPNGRRL